MPQDQKIDNDSALHTPQFTAADRFRASTRPTTNFNHSIEPHLQPLEPLSNGSNCNLAMSSSREGGQTNGALRIVEKENKAGNFTPNLSSFIERMRLQ